MTLAHPHLKPAAIVAPHDPLHRTRNPFGEAMDEGPAGSLFRETVIEELKSAPYRGLAPVLTAFAPMDYEGAEAALREYFKSQGENFDELAAMAGENLPEKLAPWTGEITDAEINDLVLGDDEAVGGELS